MTKKNVTQKIYTKKKKSNLWTTQIKPLSLKFRKYLQKLTHSRRIPISFDTYKNLSFKKIDERLLSPKALIYLNLLKRTYWRMYLAERFGKKKRHKGPRYRAVSKRQEFLYKTLIKFMKKRFLKRRFLKTLLLKRFVNRLFSLKRTKWQQKYRNVQLFIKFFETRLVNILWRMRLVPTVSILKVLIRQGIFYISNQRITQLNLKIYPFQLVHFRYWQINQPVWRSFFVNYKYFFCIPHIKFFKKILKKPKMEKFFKHWSLNYIYYSIRLARFFLLRLPILTDFRNFFFFRSSQYFFTLLYRQF